MLWHFVTAKVNGLEVDRLVDTGASITLVCSQFWKELESGKKLEVCQKEIFSASGSMLDINSQACLSFETDGVQYCSKVIITGIENNVILGLVFLSKYDGEINLQNGTMGKKPSNRTIPSRC